ncbi:antA/AntB antirepressor family protein [Limnobaculum xujianqingii]|uniref:antA/AntB antirepressor family protein n=1 Tax=Limnobaculum xujianqingii TaxID=2738837 RepID=UPI0011279091|nr:antA/AntB antirepressor family protein [Limnobaculum xujianqingii]
MTVIKNAELTAGDSFTQNQALGLLTELVPVSLNNINGREIQTTSAKKLHAYLGVGRDFSNWIKGRIEEYSFIYEQDYINFDSPNLANQSTESDQIKQWKTKRGGDRRSKDYCISLGMAKELAMVERNEQGRAVRRYFIQCEERLQHIAPQDVRKLRDQLKARITAANYFKPMCAALELARAEQGKLTQAHHYTSESNMIARLVLGGLTAKQWATGNSISGDPRNSMSADQLKHLSYLEQSNITLIELGWDYHQRKTELTRLSQRHLAKQLEVAND